MIRFTIDWDPRHRTLYDVLTGKARTLLDKDFSDENVLSIIQVMQMILRYPPSMVAQSARNREAFLA